MRRTAGALFLTFAALASSVILTGASPAVAASSNSVAVGLSTLTPSYAVNGSTVQISGDVVSPAGSPSHSNVEVQLKVALLQYRSDMTAGANSHDQFTYNHSYQLGTLASGTTGHWSFSASASDLGLNSKGVYALDVVATSGGSKIGALRTYLPYEVGAAGSNLVPTQVALLWPLTAAPELDGATNSGVAETADDRLATQLAKGGRLYQMVSDAQSEKGVVFSWLVDPSLLTTASTESSGYILYPSGPAGSQPQGAATWLSLAKSVLKSNGELWQLPATDPDVASLAQDNADQAAAALAQSAALDGNMVKNLLDRSPSGTLVWPADGQADPATLALAGTIHPAATVVDSGSVALATPDQSYTATGLATTPATTTAPSGKLAVSDAALDQIFAGDPADAVYQTGSDTDLLATQRFLAQTALISGESPGLTTPRTLMVTAPRDAEPDPELLAALGSAPWLKSVGLSTLLAATQDPKARVGAPVRAAATAATDLPAAALAQSAQLSTDLHQLASIMTQPGQVVGSYSPAVLSTLSTSWRGLPPADRAGFVDATANRLDQLIGEVSLVPKSDLTLSGKTGTIPFTIQNRLSQPVKVRIQLTADRDGLTFGPQQLVTVPPGSTTMTVSTRAGVTGVKITVTAQLVTSTGADYGTPESFQVSVSSIGTTALIILGLSAAVLVVAVGLRIYRSRHRRRPGTGDASGAGPDPDGAAPDSREDSALTP